MENRENTRRYWPMAVTVSVLLHGAVGLGLGLVPGRQVSAARAPAQARFLSFATLEEGDTGAVSFVEPHAGGDSSARRAPNPGTPMADTEPVQATLREPWAPAAAVPSSPGTLAPAKLAPASSAGGGTTSFFQVETRGGRIVYVVDGSASMGKNGAWAAACRELTTSVRQLPPEARFQIIIYNSEPRALLPRFQNLLEPTPALVREVSAALADLARQVPEGRTEHEPALKMAFLLRPDVVYFLTDADDLKPEHPRLVERLNQGRAVVNTIELNIRNRHKADMPLQILAHDNRGVYRAVDLEN
jgi:hypothetical protein